MSCLGPTGPAITGVSHEYGKQVGQEIPLFKGVAVGGHPNPMLEEKRPPLPDGGAEGGDGLLAYKAECKAATQKQLGFDVDASASLT